MSVERNGDKKEEVPPWFKLQAGKETITVRKEPAGCGIRHKFICLHGNDTLRRLLWKIASEHNIEEVRSSILTQYNVTEEEFQESLAETSKILHSLGIISGNIEDIHFKILKTKGGG
jgi:hypothetical protein